MNKERLQQLSQEYLDGTLLPADWEELKAYLLKGGGHPEFALAMDTALAEETYATANPAVLHRMLDTISAQHKVQLAPAVPRTHQLRYKWWAAAAILLLLATGAYLFFRQTDLPASGNKILSQQQDITIQPGKEGTILTLADGSRIVLDSLGNGIVANQNGARVLLQNGQLVYGPGEKNVDGPVFNTMSTPNGRQFRVVLPDGTKVWLNAASSITYPTAFGDKERRVRITGEVYFEVTKDKMHPFRVESAGQLTEVLGTSFNINAYSNAGEITTTLLEGSVRLQKENAMALLDPGQQVVINQSGADKTTGFRKINANIEQVMAWKNGLFNFRDQSLFEVMQQLERWYDIEVEYEQTIPDIKLWGEMGRDLPLSKVLRFLEKSDVHFRTEKNGKKLVIIQ